MPGKIAAANGEVRRAKRVDGPCLRQPQNQALRIVDTMLFAGSVAGKIKAQGGVNLGVIVREATSDAG